MEIASSGPRRSTPANPGQAGSLPRTVRVDPRLTIRLGALFALIAGMLLAWLGSAYYRIELNHNQALMQAGNERILRLSSLTLSETLAGVMADLRYLGRHNEIEAYLLTGGNVAAGELAREYAALLRQKRDYDQVRFIDLNGMERVRVDHAPDGARITPAGQLQAKGSRYYFQALARLRANEIYVSPLDLNIEHGQIEQPLKPMIRFGLAVFDSQGKRRGYVVINYLAEHLLDKIRALAGTDHPLWLLDAEGESLLSPNPGEAWSGLLPERKGRGFARLRPAVWETLRQQAAGTVMLDAAPLQFIRVSPLLGPPATADSAHLAQPAEPERYAWFLLIADSPANRTASGAHLASVLFKGGLVLALLVLGLLFALAFAIARQRALADALVADISLRLAAEQREHGHLLELARASRLASVGEMVSEIAHQINQPLAAIAMFSNAAQRTLESGADQSKLRDWLATINTQSKRASEVVQRLRRFAHRGDIKSTLLDLNSLVREVLTLVESEARTRNVALSLELAETLPTVEAAGILMEQVIYNLVHNAIQAADDPGQVTIRTHADASRVWFEVFDNGAEQAGEELRVGQSISRDIVKSYQGDLVYQRSETGSQVGFSLPKVVGS